MTVSSEFQRLLQRYVKQQLHGCGHVDCREELCATGNANVNFPRPVRNPTPRSARLTALTIANCQFPEARLCRYSEQSHHDQSDESVEEGPRDPASFAQALSDTTTIRQFFAGSKTSQIPSKAFTALSKLHQLLDPFLATPSVNEHLTSNRKLVNLFIKSFEFLLHQWPPLTKGLITTKGAYLCIRSGASYPADEGIPEIREVTKLLDHFECAPYQRLVNRLILAISRRIQLESAIENAAKLADAHFSTERRQQNGILTLLTSALQKWGLLFNLNFGFNILCLNVHLWINRSFFKLWKGDTTIQSGTLMSGIFHLMDSPALELVADTEDTTSIGTLSEETLIVRGSMSRQMEKIVRTWRDHDPNNKLHSRHILSFHRSLCASDRSAIFRMANHMTMRKAHVKAEVAASHRRRLDIRDGLDDRVEFNEEHYLLLNISRADLIKDSFDQLWQRRQASLTRPLRVRLSEFEEWDVGQDLGGVQVEYFNLICKAMMNDENQMFITDSDSGMSYFRPLSLQPLHMFELFGLLFALATYNGITLPVTFPKVFYSQLLAGGRSTCFDPRDSDILCHISDGWPVLANSLRRALDLDLEYDFEFPIHTPGLHMTVAAPLVADKEETLTVYSVSTESGKPLDIHDSHVSSLSFPGWQIQPSSNAPLPVTSANKDEYISSYVNFMVRHSVQPQLNAFMCGFFRVLDTHTLRIFLTPADLKTHVEGTSNFDVTSLRALAQYDGYDPMCDYIAAFWTIIESWPPEKLKQLLKFVTAAERIPINSLRTETASEHAMGTTFIVKHVNPSTMDLLPTSSTCFSTLYLPRYDNSQILKEKLDIAITLGYEGFGTG